jgi:undecaprenol kinase
MKLLKDLIVRTYDKFACAFRGLIAGIRYDTSITIQVILALMSIVFFAYLGIGTVEWLFVISAIFLVLITEYLNSAVEDVCDLLIKKYDLHVKEIKDIAAAAVLLAALYAVIVAFIVTYGRLV